MIERFVGRGLYGFVVCGPHIYVFRSASGQRGRTFLHDPVREIAARASRSGLGQPCRMRHCVACFLGGEISLLLHQRDDQVGAAARPVDVVRRRVPRGRREQTCQHRSFRGNELRGGFSEIPLARCLEPCRSGAEIGPIQVDRENFVLGELDLQSDRERDLLYLPPDILAAAVPFEFGFGNPSVRVEFDSEAKQFRDLLSDRGAAVPSERASSLAQIDYHRPDNPARTYAEMPVEALVLGCDDRVQEMRRNGIDIDGTSVLVASPCEDLVVAVEHGDGTARPSVKQLVHRRQG